MKAYVLSGYGLPSDLKLSEIPIPIPKEREVLVRVHATAINDWDWAMVTGKPWIYRLLFGLSKQKVPVPGMEVAGVIEALGPESSTFKAGDAVFGDISGYGFGSFAEYVCIDERALIPKPKALPFVQAASLPHASLLAYQALYGMAQLSKGQKVLINGGGGGVGCLGVQMAKLRKVELTGVDAGEKLNEMRKIGYDRVIDYRKEDFTSLGLAYDFILDCKTNRSPFSYARALAPGGSYVTIGGSPGRLLQAWLFGPIIRQIWGKSIRILTLKPNQDIQKVVKWYENGQFHTVIDGPYPLEEVPSLIQYFGEGRHVGKVVVSLV